MINAPALFAYARERHGVYVRRRNGHSWPWTTDPILQQYRFCNVFRELDVVTRWFREWATTYISTEHADDPVQHLRSAVIFRYLNRVETGQELLYPITHPMPLGDMLDYVESVLRRMVAERRQILGAAYMIKTPVGQDKVTGLLEVWRGVLSKEQSIVNEIKAAGTLKAATSILASHWFCGPFMAYEIVTDLRWTPLLNTAPDIMTWANPGPGAARGAGRVIGGPATHFNRSSLNDLAMIHNIMSDLLEMSTRPEMWSPEWPRWEMRDVEHTLCEFDKYERARLGEGKPKQLYRMENN